jgi:hypothetical protein
MNRRSCQRLLSPWDKSESPFRPWCDQSLARRVRARHLRVGGRQPVLDSPERMYQHFNGSSEAARYISVTDAPTMMWRMRDYDFIFNNPFLFNRYKPGQNQFTGGKLFNRRVWETNFMLNARHGLVRVEAAWRRRHQCHAGVGVGIVESAQFGILGGNLHKRASPRAWRALLILNGVGLSLLWTKEDMSDLCRHDLRAGDMVIVPSDNWSL